MGRLPARDQRRAEVPGGLFCAQLQHVAQPDRQRPAARAPRREDDHVSGRIPATLPGRADRPEKARHRAQLHHRRRLPPGREGSRVGCHVQVPARATTNADFPFEGYLFPDTYLVDPVVGAKGLVQAQLEQFGTVFSSDWRSQITQPTSGRPAEDIRTIVILASMVDREANNKTATDRGNVCSVYYNRLKINMTLGVDATLLYALGRLTPEPTFAELQLDSPYNTRIHAGLPPGPISNPGKAALAACINPPKTNFLFYFTDRQGTTHFETNEQDFERDKQQYGVSGS